MKSEIEKGNLEDAKIIAKDIIGKSGYFDPTRP
jgi:hypothetical protein